MFQPLDSAQSGYVKKANVTRDIIERKEIEKRLWGYTPAFLGLKHPLVSHTKMKS